MNCSECECLKCKYKNECECGECDSEHPHNNCCCDFEQQK